MSSHPLASRTAFVALACLLTWGFSRQAEARSGGNLGGGCVGCHSEGNVSFSLSAGSDELTPGEEVIFTLTVSASAAKAAGVFIDAEGVGTLRALSGEGLAEVEAGLTHFAAKPMSGNTVSFGFGWTPPDAPGGVHFQITGVAANGDGRSSGDAASGASFDFVYGCEPGTFYADLDGDGAGREDQPRTACAGTSPEGLAASGDDCNDNNASVYPGGPEYCNNIDDNCNGEVDEESLPVDQYPDADGDGYYSVSERSSGDVISGCLQPGYAAAFGDCQPNEASIHPGAEEVCNQVDDDCDGDIDEGVRPQCGEGWCLRDADTCDGSICVPGEPRAETCNLFDDDCDGEVDEEATCPAGEVCLAGLCRPEAEGAGVGGAQADSSAASSGSGTVSGGQDENTGGTGGRDATSAGGESRGDPVPTTAATGRGTGCTMAPEPRFSWPLLLATLLVAWRRLTSAARA